MSSSSDRAQVEPLAALAAVFAVGVGLTLYVGALDGALAALEDDREMAPTATDAFLNEAASFGVVDPPLTRAAADARPSGYELNATLTATGIRWQAGAPRQPTGNCVERRVSVRTAPGTVRPGRLEVCVWPAA